MAIDVELEFPGGGTTWRLMLTVPNKGQVLNLADREWLVAEIDHNDSADKITVRLEQLA